MEMHDLHVGQEIYVVSYGNEDIARKVTIERETKTQWVLSNGDRFWKTDQTEIGRNKRNTWAPSYHMEPLDTEYGRKITTKKIISSARTQLQESIDSWEKDRSNIELLQGIQANAEKMIGAVKWAVENSPKKE